MMIIKKLSQSWQQQASGDADKRQSTKVNDLLRSWQPLLRGAESTVYRVVLCSAPSVPQPVVTITEKAPTVRKRDIGTRKSHKGRGRVGKHRVL